MPTPAVRLLSALLLIFSTAAGSMAAQLEVRGSILGTHQETPYQFTQVTVRNTTANKVGYRLLLEDYYGKSEIHLRGQILQAGEERIHNLAVSFLQYPKATLIDSDGVRHGIGIDSGGYTANGRRFLNISELDNWASEKTLETFTNDFILQRSGSVPATYGGKTESVVSQIEPGSLPGNWLCYMPFHAVLCRQSAFNRMQPEHKAALIKWVDMGGRLAIYDAETDGKEPSMLGEIEHRKTNPLESTWSTLPSDWRIPPNTWTSAYQGGNNKFPYATRKPPSRIGGVVITGLFLLIAGPGNYFYCRRRNNIRLLLGTLPAISIAFCVLMLAYFLATQGFQRRGGSMGLTLLDEQKDRALALTSHGLFSGLYPAGGFMFDAETSFLPSKTADNFSMDFTKGRHLTSGIFQPTTNFQYHTALPYTTRERLIFDPQDKTVTNGFEKKIDRVQVKAADGDYYEAETVDPGARAQLRKVERSMLPATGNAPEQNILNRFLARSMSEDEVNYFGWSMAGPALTYLRTPGPYYMLSFSEEQESMQPGLKRDKPTNRMVLIGRMETAQ